MPIPATARKTGGPATIPRGQFGRQVAGAETIEIKATIDESHIRNGLKRLALDRKKAEQRIIYFFDTPKLALLKSGVIVRARRVPGNWHDTTIKIRPVSAIQVPAKWAKHKGFKLEADGSEDGIVRSASLSQKIEKGIIKRVAAGEANLTAIFDKSQELFLAEMCRIRYDLDKLTLLGPITALWWRVEHPGLPMPMTAELWSRDDGKEILEVSIRAHAGQAAFASAGFLAFLAEFGAVRDNAQQAKTRWAVSYYASRVAAGLSMGEKARAKNSRATAPVRAPQRAKQAELQAGNLKSGGQHRAKSKRTKRPNAPASTPEVGASPAPPSPIAEPQGPVS